MTFSIIRCARVVLHVTDLAAARDFYERVLGFVVTEADESHLYLRGLEEYHHHSLLLKKGPRPAVEALGYKVGSEQELEALYEWFAAQTLQPKWLEAGSQNAIGRAFRVQDPSGLPLEFFAQMEKTERLLQRYDLHRGARVQRIDHFNCAVRDVKNAYDFYVHGLGFACSEYTETEDGKLWAAWLHRKQNVHDLALMNGKGPRLHHIGFWLPDPLSLIHACDVLAAAGYAPNIERGPGRHGLSNAFFVYLRDPDGHRIELYNGDYLTSDPDFPPIRWDLDDPRRQTFWGHAAPDSWFEEASVVLDVHSGQPIEPNEPTLAKQKPTFLI
ncbi:3,4-dihydroxyphenylacetate 2,3-dioxygenase [Geobacillus sp. C56-T3]|uniref:3,4-dihydroxyphenylacetate 2,3-dioxygenase n=1 Tax=Geobacillus sp. (strain C56-T3) TaxID=691437 RepID=UPI0001D58265|nr:3,4-dihydroxyphenylacetate 2,3-dioxygenase [Geobacillus sp. C56-T3]ADI25525.1 3,4-dihydroxyphenylacetate 2,3-dioxygenase [Geobacillus sp. C56-T3]